MGNPHAVAFMDMDIDGLPLDEVGPLVEHHPMFPQRVNFEIVNLVDSSHVKARVWERGSGLTEACGTGACAVAVAARLHGYVGDDVTVSLPGGDLAIHWPGEGEVIMEGPVAQVFEGEWPD
jgi:diaminopimelate epimerase